MSTTTTTTLPLSLATVHQVMPHAPAKYLAALNTAMTRYAINNAKRVAGFLAQLAVESHELRHTHELYTLRENFHLSGVHRPPHTATSKEDYFEYWYGNRAKLGNTSPGDGYKYRGRGAIQITGKANYASIGQAIDQPLVEHPDLVETDPMIDMIASAYFFARLKQLNHVADSVHPESMPSVQHANTKLTHAVNGGYNGLHERLEYYKKGLAHLGA